jgi:hypothetical protein
VGGEQEAVLAHFLPFSCTIKRRLVQMEEGYEIGDKEGSKHHCWSLENLI